MNLKNPLKKSHKNLSKFNLSNCYQKLSFSKSRPFNNKIKYIKNNNKSRAANTDKSTTLHNMRIPPVSVFYNKQTELLVPK
jgi:hypothetical protein